MMPGRTRESDAVRSEAHGEPIKLSIVIPTYGREQVLVDTVAAVLAVASAGTEIVVVDQTKTHEPAVHKRLEDWYRQSVIHWIRQHEPSIPRAMNRGALEARGEIVLYLDDDIVPDSRLLVVHTEAHQSHRGDIIAGRVLQPWHDDDHDAEPFTTTMPEFKDEFMGGNFSIRREKLLALGGFDENFRGAAYRFEREFADRVLGTGGTIWYEPAALIRHLHHPSGGTRSKGGHLTSWNPRHPVGAYYYLLASRRIRRRWRKVLARMFSSVKTKHHLRRPWYIPVTLVSEAAGLLWALGLWLRGPRLLARQVKSA